MQFPPAARVADPLRPRPLPVQLSVLVRPHTRASRAPVGEFRTPRARPSFRRIRHPACPSRPRATNLAPARLVRPAASRHPPSQERNPKSSRLVRWHRSRRGRNSAHHARFTRLARLTPSSPSSSRSRVSPVAVVRRCRARVAGSPRLPHLVRFERVVAFRVASTAHSRSSRSPTMCPSSAATPPLFEVCCHLVR